jgi:GDP-L-fucose synthase
MIRKIHVAECLQQNDWKGIRKDLDKRPVEGVSGKCSEDEIINILSKYGINISSKVAKMRSSENSPTRQLASSPADYPPPRPPSLQVRSGEQKEEINRVTILLWGTGNVYREFLHVDDMADACVFVMETVDAPAGGQANGRTGGRADRRTGGQADERQSAVGSQQTADYFLNIGTGRDLTIRELAEIVKEIVGFNGEIRWDSSKPDGTYKKQLDVSRLDQLGWKSRILLKEGIESVYKQYSL